MARFLLILLVLLTIESNGQVADSLVQQLQRAANLIEKSEVRQAVDVLEPLIEQATQLDAFEHATSAKIKIADCFIELDQIRQAMAMISQIESDISKRNLDPVVNADFLKLKATGFHFSRNWEEARNYSLRAVQVYDSIGLKEEADATRLQLAGLYGYQKMKPQSDSIFSLVMKRLQPTKRSSALALVKANIHLGDANRSMNMDSAAAYYQIALEDSKTFLNAEEPVNGMIFNKLGIVYKQQKKVGTAVEYYLQAMANWEAWYGKRHPRISAIANNLGNLYTTKGEYVEAEKYLRQSVELDSIFFGVNDPNLAISYASLGNALKWQERYQEAGECLKKSADIRMKYYGPNHPKTASSYLNLGLVYEREKAYDKTLEYFFKAKAIWDQSPGEFLPLKAMAHHNIANVYSVMGEIELSAKWHRKGFYYLNPTIDTTDLYGPLALSDLPLEGNTYIYIGHTAQSFLKEYIRNGQPQHLEAALTMFDLFFDFMEAFKASLVDDESKLSAIRYVHGQYNNAVDAAYQGYITTQDEKYIEKAFYYMEAGKSLLLMENMYNELSSSAELIPPELLDKEKHILTRKSQLESLIYQAQTRQDVTSDSIPIWRSALTEVDRNLEELVNVIKTDYPDYFQMRYDHQYLSIQSLQNEILHPDEVFLHYILGENSIFMMAVDQTKTIFQAKDIDAAFDSELSEFLGMIRDVKISPQLLANRSAKLYHLLIKPVELMIMEKRVIVSPSGTLSLVPFEVLMPESEAKESFAELPYLIKSNAISYAFNATILASTKMKEHMRTGKGVLSFAPIFEKESDTPNVLFAENAPTRDDLVNLRGSLEEVRALQQLFRGRTFEGVEATESNFKANANRYKIIHLATHGILNEEAPGQSFLAFAESENEEEDGLLYAWELALMDLKAELGVLSACNTGTGEIREGEGVMSIGRAFAFAGCPSLLMSLWPVNDLSTADIMKGFYAELKSGTSKDLSLQQSKLNYLNDQSTVLAHPLFWAGFVLQGDSSPIDLNESNFWSTYLPLIFILIIPLLFIWQRGRRTKK
jgi:CHAT domain-containing protein/Tfp pilus assembly protein PilF